MGRVKKGVLDGFSGTIGTVVGGSWKGIEYMRSRPKRNRRPATPSTKQEIQRAKFALGVKFLRTMPGLFDLSYQSAVGETGANKALRFAMRTAVGGIYPNLLIDYSQVPVARGSLTKAMNYAVSSPAPGKVQFDWDDNTIFGTAAANDKAILVVFCEELYSGVFTTEGAERQAETDSLTVSFFSGKQVHTWLSFISPDGKEVADSVYTGMLTVS